MATKFVDNRLQPTGQGGTSANDGSSAANTFCSLYALELATINPGDVISFVSGSGPYREASNVDATLCIGGTGISFDGPSRTITVPSGGAAYTAGKYIKVSGSRLNDGQYQVASSTGTTIVVAASNNLQTEAAGNQIRVTDITAGNAGATRAMVLNHARNGAAGNQITWQFNGCEVTAGENLMLSRYKWVRSAANPFEWYCLRADGSNPSLQKPESAIVGGNFVCRSAQDTTHTRGTPGSLGYEGAFGYGDNDSLGFSTVYVRPTNANSPTVLNTLTTAGYAIQVSQVFSVVYNNFGHHDFIGFKFTFGNGTAASADDGNCVTARGLNLRFKQGIFAFADGHGVELTSSGPHDIDHCLFYWCGHRAVLLTGNIAGNVYNCDIWGTHLAALLNTAVVGASPATSITLSAKTGTVTVTAGSAVFAAGDVGKCVNVTTPDGRIRGQAQVTVFTDTTHVTAVVSPFYPFDNTLYNAGEWDLGGVINMYGVISANNEAGAIDKKSRIARLHEDFNCFYPRMTAGGGALGYVSCARDQITLSATSGAGITATADSAGSFQFNANDVGLTFRCGTGIATITAIGTAVRTNDRATMTTSAAFAETTLAIGTWTIDGMWTATAAHDLPAAKASITSSIAALIDPNFASVPSDKNLAISDFVLHGVSPCRGRGPWAIGSGFTDLAGVQYLNAGLPRAANMGCYQDVFLRPAAA